jgi:hypothetical protein
MGNSSVSSQPSFGALGKEKVASPGKCLQALAFVGFTDLGKTLAQC